jgi:hypothetical protein
VRAACGEHGEGGGEIVAFAEQRFQIPEGRMAMIAGSSGIGDFCEYFYDHDRVRPDGRG